jgi:hypothetical protein
MLPERTCETCTHYRTEAMGDYGSGPSEVTCALYEKHPDRFASDPAENDDFPFSDAPECYEPDFWTTEFANDLDGSQERLDVAYERFKAFMDHGHPL